MLLLCIFSIKITGFEVEKGENGLCGSRLLAVSVLNCSPVRTLFGFHLPQGYIEVVFIHRLLVGSRPHMVVEGTMKQLDNHTIKLLL